MNGKPRKLVVLANRNGFYYSIDRDDWSIRCRAALCEADLGERSRRGRPPDAAAEHDALGLKERWYGRALEADRTGTAPHIARPTNLYYVNVKEMAAIFHKGNADYKAGALFNGGGQREYKGEEPYGAVRALDVVSGERQWEYRLHAPSHAGLMSTAGGLVFGSNGTNFFALDSEAANCSGILTLAAESSRTR